VTNYNIVSLFLCFVFCICFSAAALTPPSSSRTSSGGGAAILAHFEKTLDRLRAAARGEELSDRKINQLTNFLNSELEEAAEELSEFYGPSP
jgi:hypothetical protein